MAGASLAFLVVFSWGWGAMPAGPRPAASPAVVFVRGPGTGQLVNPVACLSPDGVLVAAAKTDCLRAVPARAQVLLDSGELATASERVTATCPGGDGAPRDGLELAGGPFNFSYAVWPATAGPSLARVSHAPPDNFPISVPAAEYREVRRLVGRSAGGDLNVLQRFESDLDGDGAKDIVLSVDVRCTPAEMRKRTGQADGEPWSCFNGLIVKWRGKGAFAIVTQDWDLGQIGAVFDLDGDRRPEVLVFAPLDEGFRRQVFTVERRKLKPHDPWCCGCEAQAKHEEQRRACMRKAAARR
jgi:hypothetical protein